MRSKKKEKKEKKDGDKDGGGSDSDKEEDKDDEKKKADFGVHFEFSSRDERDSWQSFARMVLKRNADNSGADDAPKVGFPLFSAWLKVC